jgi:hopanoid biosynthesis associated protein HpnK
MTGSRTAQGRAARRLIVTADDFGMSPEINEAVELAHREGILTCASLVVAGRAAEDAIRRARRMPGLGVGLHLALLDAPAMAPGPSGIAPGGSELGASPVAMGIAIMFPGKARAAARREIEAQLEAYRKSGLELAHLDGHWHFHQHPGVLAMALELAGPLGLKAVRVPYESPGFYSDITGGRIAPWRLPQAAGLYALARGMRRRIAAAGLATSDRFYGLRDAGHVGEEQLVRLARRLPAGVTEAGLHPATGNARGPHALPAGWDPACELAALTSPAVRAAVEASGVELCRWADIA